jgi:UDP-glucuronate decarboxylase
MVNFLVTGDLGLIGSCSTEGWYSESHDVTVLDHLSNGNQNNLSYLKNQITWYKSIIFSEKFNGIFHFVTAPRSPSLKDRFRDSGFNCKGMISVLKLAKKDDVTVVFSSNFGIYGSKDNTISIDGNLINNPTTTCDANNIVSEFYCKIGKG